MSDIRKAIMERLGAVAEGEKAVFAAPGIVVKEDAQYIYYYPEEDDRATFADEDGKGAYTVKSNRTGKPVSAKTYRSWDEAVSASNAMNEKLPPLKKRKASMSRPGAKAKMDKSAALAIVGKAVSSVPAGPQRDALQKALIDYYDNTQASNRLLQQGKLTDATRFDVEAGRAVQIAIRVWDRMGKPAAELRGYTQNLERAAEFSRPGAKIANALSDACWQGYEAVGTKKQDGKTVPNCVSKATMGRAEQVMRDGSVHLDFKAAEEWLSGVTDSALRYIIDDASKAAKAMPDGNKFNYYHDLSLTAQDELRKRQSKKSKATAAKPDETEREDVKAGLKLMEKADKAVSDKIRTLIKEGKPQDQAVAIALDMKRRGEL